jgi:hypothetical protein
MVKYVQHVDGCVSCRVSMYNFYILYVFLVTFCTSSVGCAFGKSISTCLKTTFTCYFIRIGAGARGGHAGAVMPGAVMPGAVMPGAVKPGAVMPGAVKPGAVMPRAVTPCNRLEFIWFRHVTWFHGCHIDFNSCRPKSLQRETFTVSSESMQEGRLFILSDELHHIYKLITLSSLTFSSLR